MLAGRKIDKPAGIFPRFVERDILMAEEFSIIDSCHLDYPQFKGQIDEVLAHAEDLSHSGDFYWCETRYGRRTASACRNL